MNKDAAGKAAITVPAGGNTKTVVPVPSGSWQDDPEALPFDRSTFNQLVAQFVNEAPVEPAVAASVARVPPRLPLQTAAQTQAPADAAAQMLPVRGDIPEVLPATPTGTRRKDTTTATAEKNSSAQPAAIPVEVTIPIPAPARLQLPPLKTGSGTDEKAVGAVNTPSVEQPEPVVLAPKPLLEVKINLNPASTLQHAPSQAPPQQPSQPSSQPSPVVSSSIPESKVAAVPVRQAATSPQTASTSEDPAPVSAAAQKKHSDGNGSSPQQNSDHQTSDPDGDNRSITPLATPVATPGAPTIATAAVAPVMNAAAVAAPNPSVTVPVSQPHAPAIPSDAPTPTREPTASAQAATALREELPIDQNKPQPAMRSLSLEFTPDGSHDVKLRLSERGGDVHISVHGTDASLAGRLREGVGDLVGTLSKAGYEAEAWTPDQGRQNQRPPQEQRKARRDDTSGSTAEEFSGILQQPIQEIS